jgi:hypothetical protein
MSQCLGRYVKDGSKGMLPFEGGPLFHLPLRCQMITRSGDLCDGCAAKEVKTAEKVKEIRGTTICGPHPSYLMGRVTDPVPYWSRLYDGAWFRLKIESGCRVSEENMAKIKKAVAQAYEGVTTVEPAPMPAGGRKPKAVAEPKVVTAQAALDSLPVAPVPAAPAKRRANVKRKVEEPKARVEGPVVDISDHTIIHIKVRKQMVNDTLYYLDPKKDKLYDTKLRYVGRLKGDGTIDRDYKDSDAEN